MDMALEPTYLWLVIAALCIAVEAMGVSGIGFFFAGIAAIVTSLCIHFGLVTLEDYVLQTGVFFGLTFIFALVLWKPLKKWRTSSSSGQTFDNMVGDIAVVMTDGLQRGKRGSVNWSGTTMYAELSDDASVDQIEGGVLVEIKEVHGNVLIVIPKI